MRELSLERYTETYFDPAAEGDFRLRESEAADFPLPRRKALSHKYSYGRALLIAGALGYSGAPALAAKACERSGAGLTHLMVPESIYAVAALRCDGAVVTPLPADGRGGFSEQAVPQVLDALEKAGSCVIGPGLGLGEGAGALVRAVLREAECPLVLDADGLSLCGREPGLLEACHAPLVLTPHEGEFKRLGGDLSDGRLAGALRFCREHPKLILVLKGYGTLICRGAEAAVNPSGGPAMAKGGSGDVLCGILGALLAQGFEPWTAARCAVYLHGRAGDLAAEELGEYSLCPSDLICRLPQVFKEQIREDNT